MFLFLFNWIGWHYGVCSTEFVNYSSQWLCLSKWIWQRIVGVCWRFCSRASMTHLSTMWLMNHCSSVGCALLINLSVAPFSPFLFLSATPTLSSLTLLLTTSRHLFAVSLFQTFLLLIAISLDISLDCHFLCLVSSCDSVSLIFCHYCMNILFLLIFFFFFSIKL